MRRIVAISALVLVMAAMPSIAHGTDAGPAATTADPIKVDDSAKAPPAAPDEAKLLPEPKPGEIVKEEAPGAFVRAAQFLRTPDGWAFLGVLLSLMVLGIRTLVGMSSKVREKLKSSRHLSFAMAFVVCFAAEYSLAQSAGDDMGAMTLVRTIGMAMLAAGAWSWRKLPRPKLE